MKSNFRLQHILINIGAHFLLHDFDACVACVLDVLADSLRDLLRAVQSRIVSVPLDIQQAMVP